jgi:hypothetical protein
LAVDVVEPVKLWSREEEYLDDEGHTPPRSHKMMFVYVATATATATDCYTEVVYCFYYCQSDCVVQTAQQFVTIIFVLVLLHR